MLANIGLRIAPIIGSDNTSFGMVLDCVPKWVHDIVVLSMLFKEKLKRGEIYGRGKLKECLQ